MKAMLMLEPGETFALPDARGAVLRVVHGRVWLTQHRDPRDITLEAGNAWTIDRAGAAVVEAQDDAGIVISDPDAGITPRLRKRGRLRAWWAAQLVFALNGCGRRHVPYF